jgi:hypothetical protein
VLRCVECGCVSREGRGWVALLAVDFDAGAAPMVGVFCPVCAAREFSRPLRDDGYL